MEKYAYIRRNLEEAQAILARAAGGRKPPVLVAVTKSATDDEVLALAALGIGAIAENRAQNFRARRELLAANGYDLPVHLIGSLQTNKVKYVVADAATIQSVDSLRLAAEIERQAAKIDRTVPVLIEVNSAAEEAKGGILPEDVLPIHAALTGGAYPHIAVCGLMTMGPDLPDEEGYRPYFRLTYRLFETIRDSGGFVGEGILSMGMSDSLRVATEEGATMVRIGRRLFKKEQ
ncbi:MAG: YggS family pyridoxal phosphate-dependent enzyme [Clostridia bacterium]|nr:YggS family pyridoxal phosphate-dependent enzyme [Clostridia bacterium]